MARYKLRLVSDDTGDTTEENTFKNKDDLIDYLLDLISAYSYYEADLRRL